MQNDKRIEVEFRGLLSKNDYNKVVEKLKKKVNWSESSKGYF